MTRTKLVAATVAVATAVTLAPNAAAQDTGAPQHIGHLPSSSSELFFSGLRELSSDDKYLRQHGWGNITASPLFSSVGIINALSLLGARLGGSSQR